MNLQQRNKPGVFRFQAFNLGLVLIGGRHGRKGAKISYILSDLPLCVEMPLALSAGVFNADKH